MDISLKSAQCRCVFCVCVSIMIFILQPSLNLDIESIQSFNCKTVITIFEFISSLKLNCLTAAVVNHAALRLTVIQQAACKLDSA